MLLLERGWLSADDQSEVERVLDRKLKRHGGDARAGLHASIDADVWAALRHVDVADVQESLDNRSGADGADVLCASTAGTNIAGKTMQLAFSAQRRTASAPRRARASRTERTRVRLA